VPAQQAYFRFLVPLAGARSVERARAAAQSRPEFYDFGLFRHSPATDALHERTLAELAYTVFDTETTGLAPAEGDEIIAIGAVRIVNGRILPGETFETLVDPRRAIAAASLAVHGITSAALEGQPTIDEVLPRLRRFTEDTVLVGHNAAFDMRFLELKEAQTGVRFDQPVLDTLLLSAIVHPDQSSHGLEDIAARLGVDVVGRHTALGDARVTCRGVPAAASTAGQAGHSHARRCARGVREDLLCAREVLSARRRLRLASQRRANRLQRKPALHVALWVHHGERLPSCSSSSRQRVAQRSVAATRRASGRASWRARARRR
jgi:DNA polymerase-3 subunit epsilon